MFRNLQIYRLPAGWEYSAEQLHNDLESQKFVSPTSAEMQRQGFDSPRGDGRLVHVVNGQYLLRLKTEKKLLPAKVINQVAAARAAEMEEAQGFAPGRKAIKSVKALDVLVENGGNAAKDADERFDSDFMLMTGELAKMLADLVEALGGAADTLREARANRIARRAIGEAAQGGAV